MERQLTEGRPFGVLLRYALPVLGGNLFQLFYTLADTVIVGKTLGADALAAVGSTGIISYFVLCFVQGLTGRKSRSGGCVVIKPASFPHWFGLNFAYTF